MIWKSTELVFSRIAVYFLYAVITLYLNYFLHRADTLPVLICYITLFGLYLLIIKQSGPPIDYSKEIITAGLIIRGFLLFNLPVLSDDYYRFIWDGAMQLNGINPFRFTPTEALYHMQGMENAEWLKTNVYALLNSKDYYSIYPPVCQYIFYLVNSVAPANLFLQVVLLKVCIFFFELITLFSIRNILRLRKIHSNQIIWYALNPLVIVELTGNIHMEAIMMGFFFASVYMLLSGKQTIAAILFGLAISVKLWPLMFLPLLFNHFGFKYLLTFSFGAITTFLITAFPYYDTGILLNFSSSFQLYFQKFEFNASVYYLLKWIAGERYQWVQIIQTILPIMVFALILYLTLTKSRFTFVELCLFAFTLFLLFATTVHPWYLTPAIALSCLTRFRYVLLWSLLICGTYITYASELYKENYYIVALEYLMVISFFGYELFKKQKA